jgi:hypothetical protein
MLEKIGVAGFENISTASDGVRSRIERLIAANPNAVIAEIGVGIGATTLAIAEAMDGRGTLHLFDFDDALEELCADLAARGFTNVVPHGNTRRHWDSYQWPLTKLIDSGAGPMFDYVYLDGAHTVLHDLGAFFLIDKLLKRGGVLEFDDYKWHFGKSKWMVGQRFDFIPDDQEDFMHVKFVLDHFVTRNPRYATMDKNRAYRKLSHAREFGFRSWLSRKWHVFKTEMLRAVRKLRGRPGNAPQLARR